MNASNEPFRLLACTLAGKEHHDFADDISEVGNSALVLGPEPENPYDNTAVSVLLVKDNTSRKLGYLARGPLQKLIFLLLSHGYTRMVGKLQLNKQNSQKWDIAIWMHPAAQ